MLPNRFQVPLQCCYLQTRASAAHINSCICKRKCRNCSDGIKSVCLRGAPSFGEVVCQPRFVSRPYPLQDHLPVAQDESTFVSAWGAGTQVVPILPEGENGYGYVKQKSFRHKMLFQQKLLSQAKYLQRGLTSSCPLIENIQNQGCPITDSDIISKFPLQISQLSAFI